MSFSQIIITGHRNPDTDAVCSAVCYADFKTRIDKTNSYKGVVCGALNPQTRFVFEVAGLPHPEFMKDVYTRVLDVVARDGRILNENEPILEAIRAIDEKTMSVIPVFNKSNHLLGVIGVHEVASYFIKTNVEQKKQNYTFSIDNLERVIPGRFLKKGQLHEFSAPMMIGSMDYEKSIERMDSLIEQRPVLVVGERKRIISHAVRNQFPLIVVTNVLKNPEIEADLNDYTGTIYLSSSDTTDTIRRLWLSSPVKQIMNPHPVVLQHDEVFDEAKKVLMASDLRGLPVVCDGEYVGVVTRGSFLEKPRRKIILIDHNEVAQSIAGADEADIREIIDHHRLGAAKTNSPIYVFSKPLGSSCTIVYQHYRMHNLVIEKPYAVLLLSGILSDTLMFKSPTATPEDRSAATDLAQIAGLDLEDFFHQMLATMTTLENLDPHKTVIGDFKIYREFGVATGIAQVETTSLSDVPLVQKLFLEALNQVKVEQGLDWMMLLVTDVLKEDSILLMTSFERAEEELIYHRQAEYLYNLPGVVSRKKQLLPEILRVLELTAN